jgi:hypothetical protein
MAELEVPKSMPSVPAGEEVIGVKAAGLTTAEPQRK